MRFSAISSRRPSGTAPATLAPSIPPFWTPWAPIARECDAPGLQVQHRLALGAGHQHLGARARGHPHLHAAGGVRGGQERLRPGRVVPVGEDLLGAVERDGLGVGGKPAHAELQFDGFFHRALDEHTLGRHGRADQARDRVARRVGEDRNGRLDLTEAEARRGRGVRGEQQRVIEPVGDVRLVARRAAGAQLGHRDAELGRREQGEHAGELGRRGARAQRRDLGPRHAGVDGAAGELGVRQRHGLRRRIQVEAVPRDKFVDRVEAGLRHAVHLHHPARRHDEARFRVMGGAQRDEAEIHVLHREPVQVDPLPVHEPDPAHRPLPAHVPPRVSRSG